MSLAALTRDAVLAAVAEYDQLGREAFLEKYQFGPARQYFLEIDGRRYDSKAVAGAAHRYAGAGYRPLEASEFSGGENTVKRRMEELGFRVRRLTRTSAGSEPPALSLTLHKRYGRMAAYAAIGVAFSQRNRHQITGLSPRCPDGGYLIFITLDKSDLDAAYDYDDELFADRLRWVTRRDRSEEHPAYVARRAPTTRVSAFVRHDATEDFVYLGEVQYQTHRQFVAEPGGRVQQEYVFTLRQPMSDALLTELTRGRRRRRNGSGRGSGSRASHGTRRPVDLDTYKKAFSYALGRLDRTVEPATTTTRCASASLSGRGVNAEWERDYIDVQFSVGEVLFIGEIKVTGWLRLEEAFRVALGQLLEYAHLRFERRPRMVMFLDRKLDARRLALASGLGVAVVAETDGQYALANPEVAPELNQPVHRAAET